MNRSELIHELDSHQGICSCRGEWRSDGVVGVAKELVSISECSFDSGSDKAHPGFQEFLALQFACNLG
jgi:hypothetical protein